MPGAAGGGAVGYCGVWTWKVLGGGCFGVFRGPCLIRTEKTAAAALCCGAEDVEDETALFSTDDGMNLKKIYEWQQKSNQARKQWNDDRTLVLSYRSIDRSIPPLVCWFVGLSVTGAAQACSQAGERVVAVVCCASSTVSIYGHLSLAQACSQASARRRRRCAAPPITLPYTKKKNQNPRLVLLQVRPIITPCPRRGRCGP